jgi:predicted ribosomally synthesized peptide with nif11-like leader
MRVIKPLGAMSEEQLSALLAKLKEDAGLQEKLKGAADLDAAVALAREAGFVISVDELEAAVSARVGELSDEELESVTGGGNSFQMKCVLCLSFGVF